jgi:hypothetical protein
MHISTSLKRCVIVSLVLSAAVFASPSVAGAQGFGLGGRMAWVTADSDADLDSVRFVGGQIRMLGPRWGIEISLDHNTETLEILQQKISETPIQTSLLMRLASGSVSPFLLGGGGWYKRKVEFLDLPDTPDEENAEFGWHAGGGLEVFAGRHVGIHGDYRYTFLDFGDDDDDEDEDDGGLIGGLLPGHRGSMWTLGVTFYF